MQLYYMFHIMIFYWVFLGKLSIKTFTDIISSIEKYEEFEL